MGFHVFSLFFVIFIILQKLPLGCAIICYQCEEVVGSNMGCYDLVVGSVLRENCTSSFVCIKYIQTEANVTTLRRSCAPHTKCEELGAAATRTNVLNYCDTCNSTNCNSAMKVNFFMSLSISSFLYAMVRYVF